MSAGRDASDWDAIVVGAGPAGMSAAATLAEGGARILLIDEQREPGGQVYRDVERNSSNPRLSAILGKDYAAGRALAARLRRSGAILRFETSVWRIDDNGEIWAKSAGKIERLCARAIVLASGAIERPVPMEGWTLPGVMTIGAMQIMLKSAALGPHGRVVLAGSGPLFYLFARQCIAAGIRDLTLVDTTPASNFWPAMWHLPWALTGHGWLYLLKGVGMLAALRLSGVKIHRHAQAVRVEGEARAEVVSFDVGRRRIQLDCDIVGLHEGVIPQQQMARSLDCAHDWDAAQRCFRPRRDLWGQSSKQGIYIAGDAAGILGAQASVHDGTIAALAILTDLGLLSNDERDRCFRPAHNARRAHLSVRPFLDRLYLPRDEIFTPPDAVIVCRCEGVSAGKIREIVAAGCLGPNQAKAFLRAGMGPCQGRLCGPTVVEIIAKGVGQSVAETGYYRIRSPIKPVTVGEMANQMEVD